MLAEYYQRIQLVMAHLGYYRGEFDGIWGPDCVAAMRAWEMADEFEPAAPNNGMPFRVNGKLPKGLHWGLRVKGLMCAGLTEERIQELMKDRKGIVTAVDVEKEQKPDLNADHQEASDLGMYHNPEAAIEPVPDSHVEVEPERLPVPDYLNDLDPKREVESEEPGQEEPEEALQEEPKVSPQKNDWTSKKRNK